MSNKKISSALWFQGEPIATIPPRFYSLQAEEHLRLIEVIDGDLPLSISRIDDKDYPIVGERSTNSLLYRPMDSIVLARLDKNKEPVCIGYQDGRPSLFTVSIDDAETRRLPYAHVQGLTGLHFWEDKPLFVMIDCINRQKRAFLIHGTRVIDSGNSIQALSVGREGPCYARQDFYTRNKWSIVAGTSTYGLGCNGLWFQRATGIENLIAVFRDQESTKWECLAHQEGASYLGNNTNTGLGGVGFHLTNLSLIDDWNPLVLEQNNRDLSAKSPEPTYTVVKIGPSLKRFPLPWLTQSQKVKRLVLVKDKPALVVGSVAPTKEERFVSSVFYDDDHSPFYDEILPDSLQADDKTLSFVARKGFDIFRVTRAI